MHYTYKPSGVCAREMVLDLKDDGTIEKVVIRGACPGNSVGISKLVVGMKAKDVIERFRGVRCMNKQSSCPDQLSLALEEAMNQ